MRASHIAVFLLANCAAAQPPARRSFDVASIKKNDTCASGGQRASPGRLDFSCVPVRALLVKAYGSLRGDAFHLGTIRVLGGPSWIDNERYDVSVKAEGRATLLEMEGPMLIGMLEDRFHLKAHTEPRDTPVYELRLMEGPSKLRPIQEGSCKPLDVEAPPESGDPTHYCGLGHSHQEGRAITQELYGVTMAELANRYLLIYAGEYVVDRTGLSGRFDMRLEFQRSVPLRVNGVEASSGEVEPGAPTIFTALHGFGLKLVSAKAPIDVVVVDEIQRPSEN
jgi:uncharacterized protein (TIGR03435 family)